MIFSGLELMGDVPFRDVVIHSLVHAPDGRPHVEEPRHGMNPLDLIEAYGADATRYGLMKMASAQDVRFSDGAIEEGRKLANKLWNVSRLDPAGVRGRRAGGAAALARGALDPRAALADAARARAAARRVRLLAPRRRALPPDVRRLLRLVRGGDQAAALRRRRRRARDRGRRARAAAQAAASRDAARDRGDLDALPDRKTRLIVAPWPEAGDDGRRRTRSTSVQDAAATSAAAASCRSGSTRSGSGSSTPSSGRSGRRRTATSRPSASGCARRSSAPRRSSRTSASSPNAPADVVEAEREKLERYRRELDAISD